MGSISTPVVASMRFTDFIMELVTADLTDGSARRRSRDNQGPSIAWVIGHLAHHRYLIMNLLGHAGSSPFAKQFGDAGATDGRDYPAIAELREQWRRTSAEVLPVVEAASDELIGGPLGGAQPHGEKRVLDVLAFHMWHESYHMGQLGTLRAQFGMTPTAELATAAAG